MEAPLAGRRGGLVLCLPAARIPVDPRALHGGADARLRRAPPAGADPDAALEGWGPAATGPVGRSLQWEEALEGPRGAVEPLRPGSGGPAPVASEAGVPPGRREPSPSGGEGAGRESGVRTGPAGDEPRCRGIFPVRPRLGTAAPGGGA